MTKFHPEAGRVAEMYDYLIAPSVPAVGDYVHDSNVTAVFGRKSADLVDAVVRVARRTDYLVISGNVGKDSGDLPFQGIGEGDYVADAVAATAAIDPDHMRVDRTAKNGLDNARNIVAIITAPAEEGGLGLSRVEKMGAAVHSTSVRRLGGTIVRQATVGGLAVPDMRLYRTGFDFDPTNPFHAAEVAGEINRIDNLSKGDNRWMDRPDEFPEEMAAYAVDLNAHYNAEFAEQGILNPSTADDTRRDMPIMTAFPERG